MINCRVRTRLSPEAHTEVLNFQVFRSVSSSPTGTKAVEKGTQTAQRLRRVSPRGSRKYAQRKLGKRERSLQERTMRLDVSGTGCGTGGTQTPKLGRNKNGFRADFGPVPATSIVPQPETEVRPPTFGRTASPFALETSPVSAKPGPQTLHVHRSAAKVPLPPLLETHSTSDPRKRKRGKRLLQSPDALSQQYLALMAATERYLNRVQSSSKQLPASSAGNLGSVGRGR